LEVTFSTFAENYTLIENSQCLFSSETHLSTSAENAHQTEIRATQNYDPHAGKPHGFGSVSRLRWSLRA
jgi:hypothetical protein